MCVRLSDLDFSDVRDPEDDSIMRYGVSTSVTDQRMIFEDLNLFFFICQHVKRSCGCYHDDPDSFKTTLLLH
jgi:hypothetical protein